MGKYRKLFAAIVGMIALVAGNHFGVAVNEADAAVNAETAFNSIVGLLTALGVYGFRNNL